MLEKDSLPLKGIRVLDLSRVLAGPYCGLLLSMLGAEVIKVEDKAGDEGRQWGPFSKGKGTPFLALNLNKKGMVVDLKHPLGQKIICDLVPQVDVLVENFKTGTMEKFNLGHEKLMELNPKLVYVALSAFGRSGPKAKDPGYEAVLQAFSGVMSITGEPEGNPVRCGTSFLDMGTGIVSALGVLSLLYRRKETGKGGLLDTSLLQTALGMMSYQVANYLNNQMVPKRYGSGHPMVVPYQVLPTKDGYLFIAAGNQNLFQRLCKALEMEELLEDPRFATNPLRVEHREALVELLGKAFLQHSTDTLQKRFDAHRFPYSRVNSLGDMLEEEHLHAVDFITKVQEKTRGEMLFANMPFFLDGKPGEVRSAAPELGEHTKDILGELGYSSGEMEKLEEEGVIAAE